MTDPDLSPAALEALCLSLREDAYPDEYQSVEGQLLIAAADTIAALRPLAAVARGIEELAARGVHPGLFAPNDELPTWRVYLTIGDGRDDWAIESGAAVAAAVAATKEDDHAPE